MLDDGGSEDVMVVRIGVSSSKEKSGNGIDLEDLIVVKVIVFESARTILWW